MTPELREKIGILSGKMLRMLDLDGIFILTPMVPGLAREIERLCQEVGLSVDELLQGLRQQREQYNTEKYSVSSRTGQRNTAFPRSHLTITTAD